MVEESRHSESPSKATRREEDEKQWYVIHTYSGYEDRVKQNLEQRIKSMDAEGKVFQVIVPAGDDIEVRGGQRRTVVRKFFPGYVLVEMKMCDESWNVVRNTPGVTSFVGTGTNPLPLDDEEVNTIIRQMETEAPRIKVGFSKGQSIRVSDGPFTDFVGVVDAISPEKGKVRVLISFFGRETPVELDFLQVEKL